MHFSRGTATATDARDYRRSHFLRSIEARFGQKWLTPWKNASQCSVLTCQIADATSGTLRGRVDAAWGVVVGRLAGSCFQPQVLRAASLATTWDATIVSRTNPLWTLLLSALANSAATSHWSAAEGTPANPCYYSAATPCASHFAGSCYLGSKAMSGSSAALFAANAGSSC